MASLKEIRERISSVQSTQQITRAMTMVAAAKLRRYQDKITQMRPYSSKLQDILHHIASGLDTSALNNPYYEKRPANKVLIVAFTSDRGLCGSFNNQIFKKTQSLIKDEFSEQYEENNVQIMSMGKKGTEWFKKYKYPVWRGYTSFLSNMEYQHAKELGEELLSLFASGEFDEIRLVYNKFKNPLVYIPTVEKFLPVEEEAESEEEPAKKADDKATAKSAQDESRYIKYTNYIYEPSKVEIMDTLIPQSLIVNFYRVMLDSLTSEFGARMTAMDQATENAEELIKGYQVSYNKARQAAITKEISEIVGGAQALQDS